MWYGYYTRRRTGTVRSCHYADGASDGVYTDAATAHWRPIRPPAGRAAKAPSTRRSRPTASRRASRTARPEKCPIDHEQHPTDDLDGAQMLADPRERPQRGAHEHARDDERDPQTQRVDEKKERAGRRVAPGCGERQDGCQHRPHTRRPPEGERDPHHHRARRSTGRPPRSGRMSRCMKDGAAARAITSAQHHQQHPGHDLEDALAGHEVAHQARNRRPGP